MKSKDVNDERKKAELLKYEFAQEMGIKKKSNSLPKKKKSK